MRTRVNARQAHALGALLSVASAALVLDSLGDPGEEGPLLIDFDHLTVTIDEDGVCSLTDVDQIAAVA